MRGVITLPFLIVLLTAFCCIHGAPPRIKTGKETWSYVSVRNGAYMFFWLYYTTADVDYKTRPLVLWLQGGPGASSTGVGNFLEIGPQDEAMRNRTNAWTEQVNVLFVDNPVGTGFSYVNNTSLLAQNNTAIADDLVSFMKGFLKKVPEFEAVPLYIFAESYGGKMAVKFAQALRKAVEAKKISCQLAGVALGDSWISPVEAVESWGPFLYATSLVDSVGLSQISTKAKAVSDAVTAGKLKNATMLWSETEELIEKLTNGVNFYNILSPPENSTKFSQSSNGPSYLPLTHPNHIMGTFSEPQSHPEVEHQVKKAPQHIFSSHHLGLRKGESLKHSSNNKAANSKGKGPGKITPKPNDKKWKKPKTNIYDMVGMHRKNRKFLGWRTHKPQFGYKPPKHEHGEHSVLQKKKLCRQLQYLYNRRVGIYSASLDKLMNGPVKDKLKIIPKNVTWGGQSASVFEALSGDFMVSAVKDVESLLNNTSVKVVVYNGQLDLIVDTPGVQKWVENLKWAGTSSWLSAQRKPIETPSGRTAAFSKSYKNFTFYWIMDAGHMVPADTSEAALKMMKEIVGLKEH